MDNFSPIFIALLASFFWGMSPVFEKIGLFKLDPLAAIFIRSISVTILVGAYFTTYNGGWSRFANSDKKAIVFALIGGIFSALIGQWFYFKALKSGNTSTVVPITP